MRVQNIHTNTELQLCSQKWLRWKVSCKEYLAMIKKKKPNPNRVFIVPFYTCPGGGYTF